MYHIGSKLLINGALTCSTQRRPKGWPTSQNPHIPYADAPYPVDCRLATRHRGHRALSCGHQAPNHSPQVWALILQSTLTEATYGVAISFAALNWDKTFNLIAMPPPYRTPGVHSPSGSSATAGRLSTMMPMMLMMVLMIMTTPNSMVVVKRTVAHPMSAPQSCRSGYRSFFSGNVHSPASQGPFTQTCGAQIWLEGSVID